MPQVPIDWFKGYAGGQNLYAGKELRQWQRLKSLTQGMYDLGYLLRKERSKGLPPGTTDEDLAQQEEKLESQLGSDQAKVRDDTTHGVERHVVAGDAPAAEAIKNDPAAYAAQGHEEQQGFFPKLGNFMVEGVKRLAFGDPKRQERLSHIRQMEGTLQAEKDKENFAKSVGQMCMKSEDPDACLREMGGGRVGIRHLPKMTQKPTAAQAAQQPDEYGVPPPPKIGGSLTDRMDYRDAERRVRDRYGGHMPENAEEEVDQEVEKIKAARRARIDAERSNRTRADFDYKQAATAARQAQRDLANRLAKGGGTITESWYVYRDIKQREWQLDDIQAARLMAQHPDLGLVKIRKGTRESLPVSDRPQQPAAPAGQQPPAQQQAPAADQDVDEGERDYGEPFYFRAVPPQ
jgi:hypothetical protein